MGNEIRTLARALDVRAAEGALRTIGGYAAVFGVETNIGWFRERIAPGAFGNSLSGDVRALFDHDAGRVLGRTTSGTLRLGEDATGLSCEIDLPDTSDGRDVEALITRGDISGMSFGFRVLREEWDETDPNSPLRTILEVELFEVSVVTFPAYADTDIALRNLESARKERAKQNHIGAMRRLRMKANLDHKARRLSTD